MRQLKVMTWNVLYNEKADDIISLVKKINPDILCCQEITTNSETNPKRDVPREISEVLGGHHIYQEVLSTLKDKPASMGNAVISKYPIIKHRHVFVQKGGPDVSYSQQNRAYVEATLQIDTQLLTVGTTHLSYVDGFVETKARNQEADKLLETIGQNREAFMVAGDFNSAPDSRTIKKLEQLFTSAGPPHAAKTFTTKPFTHGSFSVNDLDWRLDYIFVSKDIKVLTSKIIKTDVSDHLPIVAEIQI